MCERAIADLQAQVNQTRALSPQQQWTPVQTYQNQQQATNLLQQQVQQPPPTPTLGQQEASRQALSLYYRTRTTNANAWLEYERQQAQIRAQQQQRYQDQRSQELYEQQRQLEAQRAELARQEAADLHGEVVNAQREEQIYQDQAATDRRRAAEAADRWASSYP